MYNLTLLVANSTGCVEQQRRKCGFNFVSASFAKLSFTSSFDDFLHPLLNTKMLFDSLFNSPFFPAGTIRIAMLLGYAEQFNLSVIFIMRFVWKNFSCFLPWWKFVELRNLELLIMVKSNPSFCQHTLIVSVLLYKRFRFSILLL